MFPKPLMTIYPSFRFLIKPDVGDQIPQYLTLLHMEHDAILGMQQVWLAIERSPDVAGEVREMFAQHDWRPHLVAAVTLLTLPNSQSMWGDLWSALDANSWACPQLAAAASIGDPDFAANARRRTEQGCPTTYRSAGHLEWIQRYGAEKPTVFPKYSGKALAALISVCLERSDTSEWANKLKDREDLTAIMGHERVLGTNIAVSWRRSWLAMASGW